MGFPYPHYRAELLLAVSGVCLVTAIVMPLSRVVPDWAALPLVTTPPFLLLMVCVWFWFRTRGS